MIRSDTETTVSVMDALKFSSSTPLRVFNFDFVHSSMLKSEKNFASQQKVFMDIGFPIIQNVFAGFNCSLFAYGQTGSGKSYTMLGSKSSEERGIIPRICEKLFSEANAKKEDVNRNPGNAFAFDFRVEVSYLELYMERVRDLLNPSEENLKGRNYISLKT